MKALKTNILLIVVLAVMGFIVVTSILVSLPKVSFAGSPPVSPAFGQATTTTTISVTTSTRILATTTNTIGTGYTRSYANICNTSATKAIVILMNADKPANATTNGGVWINANTCYEITDKMLYQGSVTASSSDQSAVSVLVNDYVY